MALDEFVVKASPYDYTVKFTNTIPMLGQNDFVIVDEKLKSFVFPHTFVYAVEAKEENKTITTVMDIVKYLSGQRTPARIVVVGGGIIQDIGAFLSTIFNRGIEWIYWPTTLLAMADSCIGGKSSLNHTGVKNKIGTFSCPHKVFINTLFLNTLDFGAIRSGQGEILKLCMIGNALDIYEKSDEMDRIKIALLIKRAVIEVDQFDKGIRRALNYGHTIGHALESLSGYTVPHGVAVIKGMLIENRLFGYSDPKFERLATNIVNVPGVDTDVKQVYDVLLKDKKVSKNIVQFAVPREPGDFEFKYMELNTDICARIKGMISE